MSITILPAQLANQIAAGEVVERPASVVKELVENSLDAGASNIRIDIEKGGTKRIKITDNGQGIAKDELSLALSRHATSKIKNLDDLEAISSLGFRGEALASISSVARLTLTSKPQKQASAWQACTQGRDMQVVVKPAAHPNGTSIDVVDLFYNTPARRKFLRTEKTEFSHIEEVIKRIALANFSVSFTLSHNQKIIKQFRCATTAAQRNKRVAQVCGQKFIDHALEVDCQHNGLHLYGWIAKPEYFRKQHDLSYSYVNNRMMRDKLINHAIRQAYAELLPKDSYPAFVLFLNLDYNEVDVNVHPAKHEVRFQQSRYVHDFVYSVCHRVLLSDAQHNEHIDESTGEILTEQNHALEQQNQNNDRSFITPLRSAALDEVNTDNFNKIEHANKQNSKSKIYATKQYSSSQINERASHAYSDLMTPLVNETDEKIQKPITKNLSSVVEHSVEITVPLASATDDEQTTMVHFQAPHYIVFKKQQTLKLLSLKQLDLHLHTEKLSQQWQENLISQPLLLPISITVEKALTTFIQHHQKQFLHLGITIEVMNNHTIQIRQFPALLREQNVARSFDNIITYLMSKPTQEIADAKQWQQALAQTMIKTQYTCQDAILIWQQAKHKLKYQFEQYVDLNSVALDLTSSIRFFNEQ